MGQFTRSATASTRRPFTPEANARGRIAADRVIDALGKSRVEYLAPTVSLGPSRAT
jgi:hypothetical protein